MEKKGMSKEKDKNVCKAVWDDPKMTIFLNLLLRRSMRTIYL
jgi:hypothetical protein